MENYNSFDDFEELQLSEQEIEMLKGLRLLSMSNHFEYGRAIVGSMITNVFTNMQATRAAMPEELGLERGVRLFHSHTNKTPLSLRDLSILTNPAVVEVTVITIDGAIFRVMRTEEEYVSLEEFSEIASVVYDESNFDIMKYEGFIEWDEELRNYMAIKEQMYRIVRQFYWRAEGGRI